MVREFAGGRALRMLADGTWPWSEELDSTDSEDVIESEDLDDDV
jgi:hypothetical protein